MSFYRISYYPLRDDCFKHMYFPRNRMGKTKDTEQAEENAQGILDKLAEDTKRDESLSRSKRTIRDLILCNSFTHFCTFTFNPEKVDRYNFAACKKRITELFKNYKNRYAPDFRYILVPEFHKDGGIHFHGMVRGIRPQDFTVPRKIFQRDRRTGKLRLVPNTKRYVDWAYYSKKLGFFSCSRVKHYEKCARYVSKYITKDLVNMALGQRVFMASTGLNRPELIFDCDDIPRMFGTPDFENEFVAIKESADSFGILPDWWNERCADFADMEPDDGGPMIEEEIFWPRMTGEQLALGAI